MKNRREYIDQTVNQQSPMAPIPGKSYKDNQTL